MKQILINLAARNFLVSQGLTPKTFSCLKLVWGMAVSFVLLGLHPSILAMPLEQYNPDQDTSTLELKNSTRGIARHFLLHEQGGVRYFSAGVGKEERRLHYPAFPLKLVLAKDNGSFLAYVSVEIRNQNGSLAAKIPAKHVTGPWLFIDLETGVYEIVATNKHGEKVKRRVPIKANDPLALPFYWNS